MSEKCLICKEKFESKKALTTHIQVTHKMKSKEYTIKHIYGEKQPMCKECGAETRYVSLTFKEYCKEHSKLAMKKGGKKGGKAEAWSKGKTKKDDPRLMEYSKRYSGKGNPFYGKKHTKASKRKMKRNSLLSESEFQKRIKIAEKFWEISLKYDDYYSRQKQRISVKCKNCKSWTTRNMEYLEQGSKCHKCYPVSTNSKAQEEIRDYILDLGILNVEYNTRKVISPKELDIYLPEQKFAIEYNGLYWHHEGNDKDKDYHRNKTQLCEAADIHLFHIFSDEWLLKPDVVKSMISHRLGKSIARVYARKCKVLKLSKNSEYKAFFEANHISGHARGKTAFALEYKGEIVACLSLRKPEQKKYKNTIEIARYCTKLNHSVVGGLSKLLKEAIKWAKENKYDKMLSYCDLRFGYGKGYEKIGFKNMGDTAIDYWYTNDIERIPRHLVRASSGKSEKEVAKDKNLKKIYGCGSRKFILKL